jgi:hypothetical protein
MPSSTSSAAAPRHSTRTVTKSRLKLGKNWTLSLDTAKKPASIRISMNRLAATGWWTKVPRRSVRFMG